MSFEEPYCWTGTRLPRALQCALDCAVHCIELTAATRFPPKAPASMVVGLRQVLVAMSKISHCSIRRVMPDIHRARKQALKTNDPSAHEQALLYAYSEGTCDNPERLIAECIYEAMGAAWLYEQEAYCDTYRPAKEFVDTRRFTTPRK